MKKIFFIILIGIFLISLASAETTTATFDFISTNTDMVKVPLEGTIDSDTFMLQVRTTSRVLCRYSNSDGMTFDQMQEGSFEYNFETIHKKVFGPLSDGVYRYFIKCRDINDLNNISKGTAQLEAIVTVNARIGAIISMDSKYLKEGKHEVSLQTTKIPIGTPTLSYSYDGITYSPIVLHGSGKSWKGHITIPKSTGERVGTFRFEARDLENRIGRKIYSGETFEADTSPPRAFSSFDATGEYGQIRLKWFIEEDNLETIRIYRSDEPNAGISNFYKSLKPNEEYFVDTSVTKGKTYYYKIAAIDKAGNLGDFSREVSAVQRNDNSTTPSGLASNLIYLVDSLLTEIKLIEAEIKNSQEEISSMEESGLLEEIGIQSELSSSSAQISALEKEVLGYKLQSLTRETLESRISSSRVKLNMIRKNIPDTVSKLKSDSKEVQLNEENIRIAILKYAPQLTPFQIEKAIRQTLRTAKENELKIFSEISSFEITYLDGSKSSHSIIKHRINGVLEKKLQAAFVLSIPDGITGVSMKSRGYSEVGLNLYKFETDTKSIIYTIKEELHPEVLNEIGLNLVQIPEESTPITGYFLSNVPSSGSIGLTILILLAISLVSYLGIVKRKSTTQDLVSSFIQKAHKVKALRNEGKNEDAEKLYESLKIDYVELSPEQKSKVINKVMNIHKNEK